MCYHIVVLMLEQRVAHGFCEFKINTSFFLVQWSDVEEVMPCLGS